MNSALNALSVLPVLLAAAAATAQQKPLVIANEALSVRWDPVAGKADISAKPSGRTVLREAQLGNEGGAARVTPINHPKFGGGRAIEVSHPTGNRDAIMLFPNLPFALIRSSLHNRGTEPTVTKKLRTLSAVVDLGKPADALKTLGTGGLLAPDKNPGSYAWLAVAEPRSRNGVVFGWLTHDRGSGVVFSKVDDDAVRVEAQIDYGRLRIAPGETEDLETLAVGYFADARLGLEAWADTVANVYDIRLPPQPTGYCTWYSRPYGGASDETHIVELASFAATNLAPYGFSVVQIDDKWQDGISTNGPKRNFTTQNPRGPYPHGMKATADQIKALGLVPGLWFMPFAGTYYDPFFQDHPDWFVKRASDGRPYETAWGGTSLDMTQPGARAHLSNVVHRIAHEWGYTYFKIDGLWTGTGTRQQYVNSGYKDDNIGDAIFTNPDKTNIEAYRDGLRLLREVAGTNVFVLGCNGPQNMRSYGGAFGLLDGMRIGPDNGSGWRSLLRGPLFGSRQYFLHGRIWYNDPDPVYVRADMPLNHAQLICSWVALSGQLDLSSEWLPGLPPERLDILKHTMPGHGLVARPVDLFENEPARIWALSDSRHTPRRNVIGLFNWTDAELSFDEPLDRLGLDVGTDYVAFDYWGNEFVPSVKGRLQLKVPAQSCRILAVRPRATHPQILSTSRHVTQGIVDVLDERWDESSQTLRALSKLVIADACELRIVSENAPSAVEVSAADRAAGVKATFGHNAGLARVVITSPSSREVSWSVRFD